MAHARLRESEDLWLLHRVLRHDERAWRILVDRMRGLLLRCITNVTSRCGALVGPDDVDDILADVYLNLLRDDMHKLRAYDPRRGCRLSTFLGMIATHAAYDHVRRAARQARFVAPPADRPEIADDDAPSPLDALDRQERLDRFADLIDELSPRDRLFVELYFVQRLSPPAVAQAMGISVTTVYTKRHKLQARLRRTAARLIAQETAAA